MLLIKKIIELCWAFKQQNFIFYLALAFSLVSLNGRNFCFDVHDRFSVFAFSNNNKDLKKEKFESKIPDEVEKGSEEGKFARDAAKDSEVKESKDQMIVDKSATEMPSQKSQKPKKRRRRKLGEGQKVFLLYGVILFWLFIFIII